MVFGSDRVGSPCGSSNCGVATSGVEAAVAGSNGSPEGPASAGAIVVAVSAAIISSAERTEANIRTVNYAVNFEWARQKTMRILPLATVVIPRLAWHFEQLYARKMPPALSLVTEFLRSGRGSTRRGRFSDESFGVCDVQFN